MTGIGIIGLGVMGSRVLQQIVQHPDLDAIVAWDLSNAALKQTAQSHPELELAQSALDVIARDTVRCVYIASPPSSHLNYINMACDHDKAVFCEKPLALDLAEAIITVERTESEGRQAAMNFPHATAPAAVALAEAVKAGRIGTVREVDVEIIFPQWPESWQVAATWLGHRAEGGFVREVVTHMLFLAQRLLGPLELKGAEITWPDDATGAETAADIRLTAGGVPVRVRGRVEADAGETVHWTVSGERGALRLVDWYGLEETSEDGAWALHPANHPYDPVSARLVAGQAQLDGLEAMLDGKPHAMAQLREGLDVQQMIETILSR
ncbi:MAG: Gfo/Idh/MocA family protein [Alphaproteobacteria bacterium]|jgi:predicted dehydrogenase